MIRLLLVDDQQGIRQGLRMRLTLEPDITVVGEANTGEQVLTLVQSLAPDIVLMDVEMPGMDGIAATAALQECTGAPLQSVVVMLSVHDDSLTRARAQAAGAVAFVEKLGRIENLLAKIRQAAEPARKYLEMRHCNDDVLDKSALYSASSFAQQCRKEVPR
jgi:DNA-binding NarL/FixJ family response regulator